MSKYRITIITVSDEGISITCVYVPTCAHMFEAHDKAMTYAKFQMDEERALTSSISALAGWRSSNEEDNCYPW